MYKLCLFARSDKCFAVALSLDRVDLLLWRANCTAPQHKQKGPHHQVRPLSLVLSAQSLIDDRADAGS